MNQKINDIAYQLKFAGNLICDAQTAVSELNAIINRYRNFICNELAQQLHDDFQIPSHQLPSSVYLTDICDAIENNIDVDALLKKISQNRG